MAAREIPLYGGAGFARLHYWSPAPEQCPAGYDATHVVAAAARVSYGKDPVDPARDAGLIDYMLSHNHTSPFEHVSFTFEVQVPLYVARQVMRHRTFKFNEYSMRYSEPLGTWYMPELRAPSTTNHQSSIEAEFGDDVRRLWDEYKAGVARQHELYERLVEAGVAREVARSGLPVAAMTKFFMTCDLHNLLRFLRLRDAPDAQEEIQVLARALRDLIGPIVPGVLRAVQANETVITLTQRDIGFIESGDRPIGRKKVELDQKIAEVRRLADCATK
jgi:thymidylate synthase (FAD)